MTQYPESGIKLVVDSKEYTAAMDYAIFQADYFDSLGAITIDVSADVDMSALDELQDLPLDGETVDFTVNTDVTGDTSELADLPADGEQIETTVDVQETDTAKETLSAVNTIKNLKVLETIWNIAGTAVDAFKNFSNFAIQPMLSLDDAVARVNAQTNFAIPNARELISGIFYDDLGESIDQVGNLVIKAAQLKAPVDEAARAALTFTHTFSDQNPEQVLVSLNNMVKGKLAPNFTEAGDLLVRAFQNGANKGGDLLTVLGDNATAIHDMGLTGPESLSFIKTGLDNGFKSAQQVVDVLLKIKQNVTNAAGNQTSDVTKTLKILGIANPSETGDAWSAEFFQGVIDAIKNAPGLSDTDKEALFSNLVGGKQGGKTFSAFLQMTPDEAKSIFANVTGAAADAATEVDNSLSGAIDDFMLAAQKAAEEFLSSDQIDLPGKIAALKTGLQGALDVLSNDGSLSDALTVALKPIGFDDEFKSLEGALGNFVIGILQAVSFLQSLDPANWAAKAGTDALIAKQGATQLAFDLKIANPDDIAVDIATAVSRGVAPQTIADTISGTVDTLIQNGALKQAQVLVDTLSKPVDQNKLPLLANGTPMNVEPQMTPEAIAKLQAQIDTANANAADSFLVQQQNAVLNATNTVKPGVDDLTNSAKATIGPVQQTGIQIKTVGVNAGTAGRKTQTMADALDEVVNSADPAASSLLGMVDALDQIINKASALDSAASHVADVQATDAANNVGSSGPSNGGGSSTPEQNFAATTLPYVSGGGSFGGAGKSFSIHNTNIIQSDAQADALGYRTAAQLRGMVGG
jgi:hypothetical protein